MNDKDIAARLLVLERAAYDLIGNIRVLMQDVLDSEEVEE